MISMLKGQVAQFSGNQAVIMVGGVGYLVNVPAGTHLTQEDNHEVTLFTMLIVRQDSMDLYGFVDQRQREIFALLLGVSGIGPKTAMNIVSSVESNRFLEEVVSENIAYLMGLPGIGNKGAKRIVLELKERIARHYKTIPRGSSRNMGDDAVSALVTLGSVGSVKADTVEDLVRKALKELL
jgi:Holliday junction DNA helicase RuvA subunit